MRVREVMGVNIVTIDASSSCHEAAARMFRGRMRHLPVVDSVGALVGVVTETDLLRQIVRAAECCCPDVPAIVVSFP